MEELKEEDINVVYYDFYDHLKNDKVRQLCIESWKRFLPKANFICKTEKTPEIAEFIKNDRWCQECLRQGNMKNYFVDTIRLWESLNIKNYLYLDTDVYLLENPMELLRTHDLFAGSQTKGLVVNGHLMEDVKIFQNGTVMWSRKPHNIIKKLLEYYQAKAVCDKDHYNSRINFEFQNTEIGKELENYALLEANYVFYHFFQSGFDGSKDKSKKLVINEKNFDNVPKALKNGMELILYNCKNNDSFGQSAKRLGNILYIGSEKMPLEEQKEIIKALFSNIMFFEDLDKEKLKLIS